MKIPISFYNYKICVHCGSDKVRAIDKYGRPMDINIYPVSKLHCDKCGTDYVPRWIQDEDEKEMHLVAGDYEFLHEVEQIINEYSVSQRRDIYGNESQSN